MMLLPLTWVSEYEQSCLVEYVRLSLLRLGYKSPRALSHPAFRTQHFVFKRENLSTSFEMRILCDVVISSCATCAIESLAEEKRLICHEHNLP